MEKLTISSFKYGLDTRRTELTSNPGTLQTAENGYIDAGGVFRKRLAFVAFSNLGILDSNGAQGTFGIQDTDSGPMTFGSAIVFGGSVTLSQPTLASAIPTTSPQVVYQQLKHPEVSDGTTYNATYHRMTQAVSIAFAGKAYVAAKFTDLNTFLYYNGTLVDSSRNGIVLPLSTSLASLGTDLARQINALSGWLGYANKNGNAYTGGTALATVTLTAGVGGSGATANLTVSGGVITAATANAAGSSYVVGELLAVSSGSGLGGILKVATLSGSGVATFTVFAGGSGYTAATAVALSHLPGRGATVTPTLTTGAISSIAVVVAGDGYLVGDLFRVTDSTGSGDVLRVATVSSGGAASVTVVSGGYVTSNGIDVVKSPVGAQFTPVPTETAASGALGTQLIDQNNNGIAAQSASVAWKLTSNGTSGTVSITAFSDASGSTAVTLASAVARNAGGIASTIADVVAAINAATMFHGYTALATTTTATGDTCSIYAPSSLGNVTFNLTVTLTGDMTQSSGTVGGNFNLTISPPNPTKARIGTGSTVVSISCTASTSGGTGTVTYSWSEESTGSGNGISILPNSTASTVSFQKTLQVNTEAIGSFKCTATDSIGNTMTVHFTVSLSNDSNA